jgi:hypothetical protein
VPSASTIESFADPPPSELQVRVDGPGCGALSPADLRRVFRGARITPVRRARLDQGGRVVARRGARLLGVAAFERAGCELRVHEFGVDVTASPDTVEEVMTALLDALELACLAGGGRRLVVLPRASAADKQLQRRGFATISEGCAGSWFEKKFD